MDKAGNKQETISKAVTIRQIEGNISIGSPTWENGTAKVEVSTTEEDYTIEYKINEGSWVELPGGTSGTIEGLQAGDTVHIRLTNGEQVGEEQTIEIKDEIAPSVVVTVTNPDTSKLTANVKAEDKESGMAEKIGRASCRERV